MAAVERAIAPLPRGVRDYLKAFDLTAICRYRDGRLGVSRDPRGAAAAWWCPASEAGRLIREAGKHDGDIVAAARELAREREIALTEHAAVLARAEAASGRLSGSLEQLRVSGGLQFFNSEYARRRREAQAAGRWFMPYNVALARLRAVLAREAASRCGVVRDGRGGELNEAAMLPRARERAWLAQVFGA